MEAPTGEAIISFLLPTIDMAALLPGSLILVTGASGHIGSHVVNEALLAGYRVRGTARTREKCDQTERYFHHDDYPCAEVGDFSREGAFDEAMLACDAVIHVASKMSFGCNPHKVVTPVVAGTEAILRSAGRQASVKRFVLIIRLLLAPCWLRAWMRR